MFEFLKNKKRRNANVQIRQSRKGAAKCRRDAANEYEARRVRKAMIPYQNREVYP